jgi:hypothetical protein
MSLWLFIEHSIHFWYKSEVHFRTEIYNEALLNDFNACALRHTSIVLIMFSRRTLGIFIFYTNCVLFRNESWLKEWHNSFSFQYWIYGDVSWEKVSSIFTSGLDDLAFWLFWNVQQKVDVVRKKEHLWQYQYHIKYFQLFLSYFIFVFLKLNY